MKVAVIYNKMEVSAADVINLFGMRTRETYRPEVVERVAAALEMGGHNVRTIEGNMRVIDELQNFMPRVVRGERPGMVFNMAYGIQGRSRYTHIPSMLEMLGVPYVGSGPAGHALALDKVMSKILFLRHGLPTPAFWLFSSPHEELQAVRYPSIVKPKMEAVSFGLRVVHDIDELRAAVAAITGEFQQQALVEEFVPGREFAVALLGNEPQLETLPIVEIDLGGDPNAIQSVDEKLQRPRRKICPAQLAEGAAADLRRLAREAFAALGLADFARVDLRMDPTGGFHILEINSMASLNPSGSFVHAAGVAGMDYNALVNRILDVAAARYFACEEAPRPARGGSLNATPLHVRIRSYLRGHLPSITADLERMVSIDSHVENIAGVNELGQWFGTRLQQLRFEPQTHPQSEVADVRYFANHAESENDILLLGHLDTVYSYETFVPYRQERGWIHGAGVAESKGGLAVILAALQALRFARVLRRVRCGVLLTSDNTIGGRYSRAVVRELAQRSRHVVGTKYGEPDGDCITSCSGSQQYQVDLVGRKLGGRRRTPDIATVLARKLLAWQRLTSSVENTRVIINRAAIETHPGRIADRARVTLTARFVSRDQSSHLDEEIRKIAERGCDGSLQVQLRPGHRRLPLVESGASLALFERARLLAGQLEVPLGRTHRAIPSDVCEVPEGIPVLDGLGPLGADVRSPTERILRDSLIDRSALLALLIDACRMESH